MAATQYAYEPTAEDAWYAPASDDDSRQVVDEMQLEAEELLEFDRVRESLAGYARMIMAREAIMSTHPARDPDDVARLQAETAEARDLLETRGDIGLATLPDIRNSLRRALLGGVLDGGEIREVGELYNAARTAKSTVESMSGRLPLLAGHAGFIHDLSEVTDQIDHALSETGEVLDRATPQLGRLRQRVAVAYKRLFDLIERFKQQRVIQDALRSNVVASRNGRTVLEVKSSSRSFVPGIIHGTSSSGQTVFIEPTAAVNAGNGWHDALFAAQREEQRVLRNLTAAIAQSGEEALVSIQAASAIDIAMARARYAVATRCVAIMPSADEPAGQRISLIDARHPLLGEEAVPITLRIDAERRGLVITGPNTGGKTVAMKTLGLFAMMHQSGMQLPCNEATILPVFSGVYADIGDAQSIDRSVSTFSSHMQRVVSISHRVADLATRQSDGANALVLLDELGTGTDMDEGSALARAILGDLVDQGAWVCITTHHRTVADFAAGHPQLQNASVEVDPETMLPNYNLIMGAPGRSYALHVAKRLGIAESVLEQARGMIDPRREQAEEYIERVRQDAMRERETLAQLQREATQQLAEAQRMSAQAQQDMMRAERESTEMVEQARQGLLQEAQRMRRELRQAVRTTEARKTWREARGAVDKAARPLRSDNWMAQLKSGAIDGVADALSDDAGQDVSSASKRNGVAAHIRAESDDSAAIPRKESAAAESDAVSRQRAVEVGDTVRVSSLGITGMVAAIGEEGRVTVNAGTMSFETSMGLIELVEKAESPDEIAHENDDAEELAVDPVYIPSADLDVRGSRAHHIESMLGQFIDHAFVQGMSSVRIIHGRGTGALREVVREVLGRESQVSGWYTAPEDKGGDAATIANLG